MILYAVVEGAQLEPVPFDVRRYVCPGGESHASKVFAAVSTRAAVPLEEVTVWRVSTVDRATWYVAFCAEPGRGNEAASSIEALDGRIRALGGVEDPSLDRYDAQAFVRRRIAAGLEAVAAGAVSADGKIETRASFGTKRGAVLDPDTGELRVRRTDG